MKAMVPGTYCEVYGIGILILKSMVPGLWYLLIVKSMVPGTIVKSMVPGFILKYMVPGYLL